MNPLDLARWQFAVTTLYHYIFVPVTLGMSFVVAGMETVYVRTGNPAWRRMTLFWGRLFLINVAMGVVTGIVQEFQFGMNWSSYSRYVGDIFGAPLAMEGLLAFFLESTFIGVWMFTWDRLSPRLHLLTIWLTAAGTWLSASFILAANSWMQHPVGYSFNPVTGRAELHDIGAVLTNPTFLAAFPHTVIAGLLTAGAIVLGLSCWHLARKTDNDVFVPAARIGLLLTLVAAVAVGFTGHAQAQIMTQQQPMKMAAAEALWDGKNGAEFSLFAIGDVSKNENAFNISIPDALSVLATNSLNGHVAGINDVQAAYQKVYGPGDYRPNIAFAYWNFRLMVGFGFLAGLVGLLGVILWRRGRLETAGWYHRTAMVAIVVPFLGNFTGWIFTEMGRQPWVVFGLLRTSDAVSPSVSTWTVGTSLAGFTLLYGFLAVITFGLMARHGRKAPSATDHTGYASDETELTAAPAF